MRKNPKFSHEQESKSQNSPSKDPKENSSDESE